MSSRGIQVVSAGSVRCVSHEELTSLVSNALHGLGLSLVDVHGKTAFVHDYAPKIAERLIAAIGAQAR